MKENSRDRVREDIGHEMNRLARLRKQQRELMDKADRVNSETRRLREELQQTKSARKVH